MAKEKTQIFGIPDLTNGYLFKFNPVYKPEKTPLDIEFHPALVALNIGPLDQKTEHNMANGLVGELDRISTGLPNSEKKYTGGWFMQTGPTCQVWAVATGLHAIGIDTKQKDIKKLVKELYDYASHHINSSGIEETGVGLDYVSDVVKKKSDLKFALQPLEGEKVILRLPPPPIEGTLFLSKPVSAEIPADEALKHNAQVIKDAIDDKQVLLMSIVACYDNSSTPGLHAIAIVGYKIDENGIMDIQFTDSNKGVVRSPLEYLLYCALPKRSYVLKKLNEEISLL